MSAHPENHHAAAAKESHDHGHAQAHGHGSSDFDLIGKAVNWVKYQINDLLNLSNQHFKPVCLNPVQILYEKGAIATETAENSINSTLHGTRNLISNAFHIFSGGSGGGGGGHH